MSVPQNCRQTVLTKMEFCLFLQRILNFKPFFGTLFKQFFHFFIISNELLNLDLFAICINPWTLVVILPCLLNKKTHIFYFYFSPFNTLQNASKFSKFIVIKVCEQFADSSSMKCRTCSQITAPTLTPALHLFLKKQNFVKKRI